MEDYEYYPAALRILRSLTGRLEDGAVRQCWELLSVGESDVFEEFVFGGLGADGIAVTPAEKATLGAMVREPDIDVRLGELLVVPGADALMYRFGENPGSEVGVVLDGFDAAVCEDAAARWVGVVSVARTWREPVSAEARCPASWIYVLAYEPGADIIAEQRLVSPFHTRGIAQLPIEAVLQGETNLPPYQQAAVAAARIIWTRDR